MSLILTEKDQQLLEGVHGEASRMAMRIVIRMAQVLGVDELLSTSNLPI